MERRAPRLTTRVFVYGSLLSGETNHSLLVKARLVGEARTVRGFALHDLGDYPAMVRGGNGQVLGEVYEIDHETLAVLDRFEGHPSFFRRTGVPLVNGAKAEAYLLAGAALAHPIISSGSWRTFRRNQSWGRPPS